MAEKVTEEKQQDEVAVLIPNREIHIAGETIIIREYSFKDALTIGREIDQFIGLIITAMNDTNTITIGQADSIIMNNLELVYSLISVSINKPINFIESVSYEEGLQLLDWWWLVNSSFFMNAVTRKIIRLNAEKHVQQNQ